LYSYFLGCSRGDGQALVKAQRYPEHFDGIVAGSPAFDRVEFGAERIRNGFKFVVLPAAVGTPLDVEAAAFDEELVRWLRR
jgi:hypothetical protein